MGTLNNLSSVKELVEHRRAAMHGGHGFVLGLPGSGKTMVVMEQIRAILENSKDTVVVLDVNGSYREFARDLGGQVVRVDRENDVFVNPLDLFSPNYVFSRDELSYKSDFMIVWLERLLGGALTQRQKMLLERALRKAYGRFMESVDVVTGEYDSSFLPTLTDLYKILRFYNDDEDIKLMADSLEIFVDGVWKFFFQQTNVEHEGRLVVYDFMRTTGSLLGCSMLAVIESVKARYVNKRKGRAIGEKIWVFVDDCYQFLRTKDSAGYLLDFCKGARSLGCVFTGVTQNVNAFFDYDVSKHMLANMDYVHLMRLAGYDRKVIGEFFSLEEDELIKLDAVGDGLVIFNG